MVGSLLQTKINPPPVIQEVIARPRLLAQLDQGLDPRRRLTLLSAPAGSGKTVLLAQWITTVDRPAAWVALDSEDNDPAQFWPYFFKALETAEPTLDLSVFSPQGGSPTYPIKAALTDFINQLSALTRQIILILDDYHLITSGEINEAISYLLDHQPPQLQLVLATRADPLLPIARLRGRGQLVEIRMSDLRFTLAETNAFLNELMALDLASADIRSLEQRTEGWIVGLHLAALSMTGHDDPQKFISQFSGGHHFILEFLTAEVLARQAQPRRCFLLRTAILDKLCGPLCDALCELPLAGAGQDPSSCDLAGDPDSGDSSRLLARLLRENIFIIPLDEERHWYRYHHLFRDLLGNLLRQAYTDEQISALHRAACTWYESQGFIPEAVKHALDAGDFALAGRLIEDHIVALLGSGRITTLLRWFSAFPDAIIEDHPTLRMYWGWALFLNGQTTQAEKTLSGLKASLLSGPDFAGRANLLGRLNALLATIATLFQNMPQAIAAAEEALLALQTDDLIWRSRANRALGTAYGLSGETNKMLAYCLEAKEQALKGGNLYLAVDIMTQIASTRFHQGDLRASARDYQEIIDLAGTGGGFPPAGLGYTGLAEILLEWNDLEAAETAVAQGIDLCRQGGIGHNLIQAYGIQALVKQLLGKHEEAVKAGQQAQRIYQATSSGFMALTLAFYLSRYYLLIGDLHEAFRWAQGQAFSPNISFDALPQVLREVQLVWLARLYLAQDQPLEVLKLADQIIPPARSAGRIARVIEISFWQSLAYERQGEHDLALRTFTGCLRLAEPGGYCRLFLDGGTPAARLLAKAQPAGISAAYIATLTKSMKTLGIENQETRQTTEFPADSLSPRELEVLRLIAAGYSNQGIADSLVLSLNTVKKHTSNIYSKLGVTNRTQAILQAQENNLLP